jgi:hypothetical protein
VREAEALLVQPEADAAGRAGGVIGHLVHLAPEHKHVVCDWPALSRLLKERSTSMEPFASLVTALLILLAATSMRFGVDTREGYSTNHHDHAWWGSR